MREQRSAGRREPVAQVDRDLETAIIRLLDERGCTRKNEAKTICPSEAARMVSPESWRELMEPARDAALRLTAAGRIEITQGGRVVDGSTAKGPIRLRRT